MKKILLYITVCIFLLGSVLAVTVGTNVYYAPTTGGNFSFLHEITANEITVNATFVFLNISSQYAAISNKDTTGNISIIFPTSINQIFYVNQSLPAIENIAEINLTINPNNRTIFLGYESYSQPRFLSINPSINSVEHSYISNYTLYENCSGTGLITINLSILKNGGYYAVYHNNTFFNNSRADIFDQNVCSNWQFTKGGFEISKPLLKYPQNGVAITTAFTWLNYSANDPSGNIINYSIDTSLDAISFTPYNVTQLNYNGYYPAQNTTIYWRVQACTNMTCSLYSDTSHFIYTSNVTNNMANAQNVTIVFPVNLTANQSKFFVLLFETNNTPMQSVYYQNFTQSLINQNVTIDSEEFIRTQVAESRKVRR